jgi:hypothetical protein
MILKGGERPGLKTHLLSGWKKKRRIPSELEESET